VRRKAQQGEKGEKDAPLRHLTRPCHALQVRRTPDDAEDKCEEC
jgi:hypothetical protein